ncbi:alpha/beta hydrolase [Nakamurella sp. GG22]
MALLRCDFFSDVLALSTSMTVILPQATTAQIGLTGRETVGDPPVLYLLHGLSDDDTTWSRRTSIERYVAALGLAVVMPQVHRSFYTDEAHGSRYWTFLSEELPDVVSGFFRVSQDRRDTFVAGLSMGGYGALKWALREPGRFAAAASMSGALDVAALQQLEELRTDVDDRVFGGRSVAGTPDDLFWLIDRFDTADAPALSVSCGTEDPLLESNRRCVSALRAKGIPVDSSFSPGTHEWGYWDREIERLLGWLPLTINGTAGQTG